MKHVCSICGKEFLNSYSNNASPLKGECCDECNNRIILPLRLALSNKTLALVITDYDIRITDASKLTLEDMEDIVDGWVEPVFLSNEYVVLVDEDGRLKNKPVNRIWSMLEMSDECAPLVGTVILMKKEMLK